MKYQSESGAFDYIARAGSVTDLGLYIEVVRGSLGLKRLGALDFLKNHCRRKIVWVPEMSLIAKKFRKTKKQ
jgi:hypothetical protein